MRLMIFVKILGMVPLINYVDSTDDNNPQRWIQGIKPLDSLEPLSSLDEHPSFSQKNLHFKIREPLKVEFLKLAVIWQPALAYNDKNDSRPVFSIHGLWPSRRTGIQPISCQTPERFELHKLRNLLEVLNIVWPTLWPNFDNVRLWDFQWVRHGSCTTQLPGFGTAKDYFRNAVKLFANLGLNGKSKRLIAKRSNLIPLDKTDLIDTLSNHRRRLYVVELICARNSNGLDYLVEIRFCFSVELGNQLQHCPRGKDNCDDKILLVEPVETN